MRRNLRALALIAPLLIFILVTFIAPIADMLFRSVENQIVADTLPKTVAALRDWDDGTGEAPPEEVFAAFAADLQGRRRGQDPYPRGPTAELRADRHRLAVPQVRTPGR